MNNYRQMAVRYLQLNKRRSRVTVLGVAVAVMVLYTMLNLVWCWVLMQREQIREEKDYEIVFFTETAEQAAPIMADERVKSASIGEYYNDNYYEPIKYENALYINTTNPYRMGKTFYDMKTIYGVEAEINEDLAITYLQAGDGNFFFIIFVFSLLVSFIFAIFGIGIIRNSIQLSILEQIKDYGNLRCVGSTKQQLKSVVYIQGAILELTGNAFGIVMGYIVSLIIGHMLKMKVGFHFIPIVPILVAFLGDLYFAMQENCKVIVNLTPVSAIRGEYRIRKEKFKARKTSIFAKIFGMEGDYAYKSIMRSPGRFHKTIWALGVGIGAFMAVMCSTATANGYVKELTKRYGYYHVYFENVLDPYETIEKVQSSLPPSSILERITNMEGVTDAKRIYSSAVLLRDYKENFAHYQEKYLSDTSSGLFLAGEYAYYTDDDNSDTSQWLSSKCTRITCYGYDDTDMERYRQVLVDGTLDVSEHGLVLVNGGNVEKTYDEEDYELLPGYMDVEYTDYQVGDTIDIVDMGKFRTMIAEEIENLTAEYEAELAKLPEPVEGQQLDPTAGPTPQEELESVYHDNIEKAVAECKNQLIAAGNYTTYTIEGIVSRDVNRYTDEMTFILPLERYYEFTGTDESMVTGMQYHFDKLSAKQYNEEVYFGKGGVYDLLDYWDWDTSGYPQMMQVVENMKNISRGVMLFVIFVVSMSTFNIINTTASNLHLRRKEFAQLRVIGMSKERLMKMVMLEGVIADIVANIIGIILGTLISLISMGQVVKYVLGSHMHFPFLAALGGIIVSTLITCGSIYVPLRGLRQDMAADLATGGD